MPNPKLQVNPKLALMRKLCAKAAPIVRRQFGEMARMTNPVHGPKLFDDTRAQVLAMLKEELSATETPVVVDVDKIVLTAPCWLVEPLSGRRNFLHARAPITVHLACVENGEILMGGVFFPMDDMLVHVAPGAGVMGPDRLRVAGRTDLADNLVMLPAQTNDLVEMNLLEKFKPHGIHTRKSGHSLADVIEVAAGRADASVSTRATPLEALLAKIILAEAAGLATDVQGAPLSTESSTILAGNLKTHAKFLDVLK